MTTSLASSTAEQLHQVVALTCIPSNARFNILDSPDLFVFIPFNHIIDHMHAINSAAEYTARLLHHNTKDLFDITNLKAQTDTP